MKDDIMNDERIEQLLRKAPRSPAPAGLLEQLRVDIALPRRIELRPANRMESLPFIRRWFSAISFAVIFVSCIVAIAVQTNQIVGLKRENAILRTSAQNLEQLRRDNAEYRRLKDAHEEHQRLRRGFGELQQLRTEVAQLQELNQAMDKLRAENQQLQAAGRHPAKSGADDDFFSRNDNSLEKARAKAESIACVNNLKQIGLAARIWATVNNDVFPASWLAMTNELATPKLLVCPSDRAHSAANDWRLFSTANVSYEFLNPNGTDNEPQVVLARCPIHNNVCLSDGAVQQLGNVRRIAQNANDNKYYILEPSQSTSDAAALDRQRKSSEEMLRRYGLPPTALPATTNPNGVIVVEPPKPAYE
jgi:hypothetical protein